MRRKAGSRVESSLPRFLRARGVAGGGAFPRRRA